jgi:hypothetical protein
MGRKRNTVRIPHFSFRRYLRKLTAPPTGCDYSQAAVSALANVYENDELPDCVIAGAYHSVGIATGNAGDLFVATVADINSDFIAISGDPTMQSGCDEQTALNYWTQTGFADGTKLLGWLSVDATNVTEIQQAMYLFENLFFGIELPDAWINPFPSGPGFVWGINGTPDPDNGHCVVGTGYNGVGVQIDTWGMIGTMTWSAIAAYAVAQNGGELYVWISPDQLAKGQSKAPNGIDWSTLISDFNQLGGSVPVPAPPAPSPPAPSPAPPVPSPAAVTLAQAQQWASEGLALGPHRMGRNQAELLVNKALQENWPVAKLQGELAKSRYAMPTKSNVPQKPMGWRHGRP